MTAPEQPSLLDEARRTAELTTNFATSTPYDQAAIEAAIASGGVIEATSLRTGATYGLEMTNRRMPDGAPTGIVTTVNGHALAEHEARAMMLRQIPGGERQAFYRADNGTIALMAV